MSPGHLLHQLAEAIAATVAASVTEDGEGGLELEAGRDTARALREELSTRGLAVVPIAAPPSAAEELRLREWLAGDAAGAPAIRRGLLIAEHMPAELRPLVLYAVREEALRRMRDGG